MDSTSFADCNAALPCFQLCYFKGERLGAAVTPMSFCSCDTGLTFRLGGFYIQSIGQSTRQSGNQSICQSMPTSDGTLSLSCFEICDTAVVAVPNTFRRFTDLRRSRLQLYSVLAACFCALDNSPHLHPWKLEWSGTNNFVNSVQFENNAIRPR